MAGPGEAPVSFSALYNTLGRRLGSERSVLLLYLLLHGCRPFQVLLTHAGFCLLASTGRHDCCHCKTLGIVRLSVSEPDEHW